MYKDEMGGGKGYDDERPLVVGQIATGDFIVSIGGDLFLVLQ